MGIRRYRAETGNTFDTVRFILYAALILNFLIYFFGDLYDFLSQKGTCKNGTVYFSSRSKLKNLLFYVGDVWKCGLFFAGVSASILALQTVKDPVFAVEIIKIWMICAVTGSLCNLRLRNSYLYLLVAAAVLLVFC